MAIRYRITKRSNSIQQKKEQYIMQAVHTGKINLDYISNAISNECSLHEVDVKAVLMALGIKLEYYLEKGNIVDLGDVGKFKMGFQCIAEEDAAKLSPKKNIKKYHVNYQSSVKLKRKLKAGITTYKEGSRSVG
ncbi:DNA-binding protein [Polaribacter litorisediminis]|uniref:HU family DNA-binding protein n=1 Tax=Polaribacter litorisediminis TaxID=1908341 RepID=UPI001CBE54F7|nr:DNA-binding protein [Polaribacter litorisediminis]UAM98577.1 DNA-binding protein [Polaribacter litorisediminis]